MKYNARKKAGKKEQDEWSGHGRYVTSDVCREQKIGTNRNLPGRTFVPCTGLRLMAILKQLCIDFL